MEVLSLARCAGARGWRWDLLDERGQGAIIGDVGVGAGGGGDAIAPAEEAIAGGWDDRDLSAVRATVELLDAVAREGCVLTDVVGQELLLGFVQL